MLSLQLPLHVDFCVPVQSTFKNVPENYAKLKELQEVGRVSAVLRWPPWFVQVSEAYYCDNSCAEGVCPKCWLDKGTRHEWSINVHQRLPFGLHALKQEFASCSSLAAAS